MPSLRPASVSGIALICGIVPLAGVLTAQGRATQLAYQITYSQNYDPSPSPDGQRLVYVSQLDGREQLFTMKVDGLERRQLTHNDADHEDPAWSPNGRTIAFIYMKDGSETVATINADGSGLRMISPRGDKAIHPHWSPDSKRIIYCSDDDLAPPRKNDADIRVIDVATGKVTTLITGGVNTYPSYSPDGSKIAFRKMVETINSEVWLADADGTHQRNLTNHPAFDGWPAWSPDGKQLAFGSNRNSNYQIFVMNADGSGVRQLANTEGRATSPAWSRDGKTVFFPNCRSVDFGRGCEILAVKTEGSAR